MRFISLLLFLVSFSYGETLDIYLKREYPVQAKFNIYKKEKNNWEKVGETDSTFFKIANHPVLDVVFKVTATTNKGESLGSQTIYLTSNKLSSPGAISVLTETKRDGIVESPKKLKLYGIVKP